MCVKFARRKISARVPKIGVATSSAASMLNSQRALSISHGSAQTHHTKLSTAFYIPTPPRNSLLSLSFTTLRTVSECTHILQFLLGRYCTIKKSSETRLYIRARGVQQTRCTNMAALSTRKQHSRRRAVCAPPSCKLYIPAFSHLSRMQQTAFYTHAYITQTLCIFFILVSLVLVLPLSAAPRAII